ncbi:immunity 51 family protein [Kitasatospora sp. CB01950]|uniref:immunity 51 family protein n=1 Tax=Kitasatospora sp. CB01950 TaxID=1703930 RepID=UPI00093B8AD6|nr:immunity 51 family protein [Kitasatospora sp. CB01950]
MTDRETDRETYAPLSFFEYDHRPGSYCLLLTDDRMLAVDEVFEAAGQQNGGYGWEAVARSAVRTHAPQLEGRFRYDPEAGMFVAYGEDAAALRELGVLLSGAFRDLAALRELIDSADPDWFD